MARIRKDPANPTCWKAAIYIRLSREDGSDESYSVKNQRQRLTAYLEALTLEEEMELVNFYVDDGYTGTDSERDSFQRLLDDIDKGKLNCVIVKDLSRLSRNDWECKRYLQHLFVVKNIRFISLELPKLDSFKNPDQVYEMGVSIQSMYNENHCRETSIKVRGTFNAKRRKGEFIGAFAPYGYAKDPSDKHHLLIDHEVAPLVKDIFHWFVYEGMSKNGIVRKLISLDIPCPAAYKRQKGLNYHNPALAKAKPLWSTRSITAILTNQMYLGHMVQGKQKVKSYKVHTRINIPENEWFIVENTHEPIIDPELFAKAQELMERDTRTPPQAGRLYPFSGFLRCAACGKSMSRRTSKNHVYYACKTHLTQGLCSRHSLNHQKLERSVLETLQKQISLLEGVDQLICELSLAPPGRSVSKRLTDALKQRRLELTKLSPLHSELYLDWKNGDINRQEYHSLKKELEEKQAQLKHDISSLEQESRGLEEELISNPSLEAFLKHRNIQSLERGLITQLIKIIQVHEGGGLTISFNFADPYRQLLS